MYQIKDTPLLWEEFSTLMKLCDAIAVGSDIDSLYAHISNAYAYMAMTDYPTAANFLNPMPAWPVNASCEFFKDVPNVSGEKVIQDPKATALTDRQVLVFTALRNSANVYFNYDNKKGYCMDGKDSGATGSLASAGWDVLQCNQLAMPNSTGTDSMFIPYTFDYQANTQSCQDQYGLTPDYRWALREFGGYNITRDLKHYSNIVFSNGELDPWRAGGLQGDQYFEVNLKLPYYVIKGGAHHLDLRLPTPADHGTDVEWVRQQEAENLENWIIEYQSITAPQII